MHQGTSVYSAHQTLLPPAPVRIPKLKVRNREHALVDSASSTSSFPSQTSSSPSNDILPCDAPDQAASHPSNNDRIRPHSPPQRVEKKGKASGIISFLTLKEPSTAAFQEFAESQRRQAVVKDSAPMGSETVTRQKLPGHVPKVNSKWDGMPKAAQGISGRSPKQSMESRKSKKSISASRKLSSSRGTSSSSSSQRSRGQRSSQNTSPSQQPLFKVNPTPSLSPPKSRNTESSTRAPVDGWNSLHPEEHSESNRPISNVSIATTDSQLLRRLPAVPDIDTTVPSPSLLLDSTPHTPEHVPQISAGIQDIGGDDSKSRGSLSVDPNPDPTDLRAVVTKRPGFDEPQWPLPPTPTDETASPTLIDPGAPPIPSKSIRRRAASLPQSPNSMPAEWDSPTESPVTPISNPSRPVRNFTRPFNTQDIPKSTERPKRSTSTPDLTNLDASETCASTASPFLSLPQAQPRQPCGRPGRVVTKDSDLATIPESETASMLFSPPLNEETTNVDNNDKNEAEDLDDSSSAHGSVSSEMSASWYQSPRERLGLGGLIRHDTQEAPWPTTQQTEDKDFVLGNGKLSSDSAEFEMESTVNSGKGWRRGSLMGFMRR